MNPTGFAIAGALHAMKTNGYDIPSSIPDYVYTWLKDNLYNGFVEAYTSTPEAVKLISSEFFKRLIANFDEIIAGSSVRLNIYVTHSITVNSILLGMGA